MQLTKPWPFFNRIKRQILSRVVLARVLLLALGISAVVLVVWFFQKAPPAPARLIYDLASSRLPSHDGRTNFLILGVPGGDHDGADLTDSIIFLSVSRSGGPTVFLSVPRDIWIPSLRTKINAVYHYGRQKSEKAGGLLLARSAVTEVIDQPVDFVAVFDFATFSKTIDLLGGVDVRVDSGFTDNRYPVAGREQDTCGGDPQYACRYETVSFSAGTQHMDGATALKFARSRHSADLTEGTDFARSRRQARLLEAIKSRLLSSDVLRHPSTYRQILDLVLKNTVTNIQSSQYAAIFKLALAARDHKLVSAALSEPDQLYHPLVSAKYDQQWVLVPKNDDPRLIPDFVSGLLK